MMINELLENMVTASLVLLLILLDIGLLVGIIKLIWR